MNLRKTCLGCFYFCFQFLFFFLCACSGKSAKDVLELNANLTLLFVKATVCSTLANLEGEESFEALMLGQAEEVIQERICDDELILIKK